MPMPPSGSSEIAMTLRGVMWAVLTAANAKLWCAGCLELVLAKSSSKREHYPKPIDKEKMLPVVLSYLTTSLLNGLKTPEQSFLAVHVLYHGGIVNRLGHDTTCTAAVS